MARKFLTMLFFFGLCKDNNVMCLELKQVLVLSRHNIRNPLTGNLESFSRKTWPKWNGSAGEITEKGARLEGYMGEYFSKWLAQENLLHSCPSDDEVFIYANTKPRTVDSAKAFANSAFRNCNVSVIYKNTTAMDPTFNPIFHNTTESFLNDSINEMKSKLNEVDLKDSYAELNRILDIENSHACTEKKMCDLTIAKNTVIYEEGEEPNVIGPLMYGNSIVDSFVMSYYEGKPVEEIAWGEIKTPEQWMLLTRITKQNQNVRFNLTTAAKDLAQPLLKNMFEIFRKSTPKFSLFMGHDSNLNPVIKALDFKSFELVDQYEPFPIGGKLVFQKWTDNAKDYLKIEYIYETFSQLRNGAELSSTNPPQKVLMELKTCKIDKNGLCLWDDFMKFDF